MIKRYVAEQDTTILNSYLPTLLIRATGSNMGAADSLEVHSIYAQASSASHEAARILVQFPVDDMVADRVAGRLPASGDVEFRMRLFNVKHSLTLPRGFTLVAKPISSSWEEGFGIDLDSYSDFTYGSTGSTWDNARAYTAWATSGGDYLTSPVFSQSFDAGTEDLNIDITSLAEAWMAGTTLNCGIGIMLTSSQESGIESYFTKRFSARSSEYILKRPVIEARWDSSVRDNRGNFYISSSLVLDNRRTLYMYNIIDGQLNNLPGVGAGAVYVRLASAAAGGTEYSSSISPYPVTGGWVSTGIYSASFDLAPGSYDTVYDRWFSGSRSFFTSSFEPKSRIASRFADGNKRYIANITNLRPAYSQDEVARFRVFTRRQGWQPSLYVVANSSIEVDYLDNMYYKLTRTYDALDVVDWGTGSYNHTRLSYDLSGSYFDLDMNMLEVGYMYTLQFGYKQPNSEFLELPDIFRFRVE